MAMAAASAIVAIGATAAAQNQPQPTASAMSSATAMASAAARVNKDSSGLALRGYDAVAYVTDGKPTKGVAAFAQQYQGATYYFATAANRDRFAADPSMYAPQFGGYCAWAVSRNYTADGDPLAWRIVDGKLYLNYSTSVQAKWQQDIPGNVTKANTNWPGLSRK
jgi:YHS domain-containing protein